MTRAVLPTPATPSYCAAMTVGTMVKRFAHVRFLVDCLWVQLLFTLSVTRDIFRTPALIWDRSIDSGNQVGRTRSDIQAAGPRRCQSQIVLLLLGCKAGLIQDSASLLGTTCGSFSANVVPEQAPFDHGPRKPCLSRTSFQPLCYGQGKIPVLPSGPASGQMLQGISFHISAEPIILMCWPLFSQ